MSNVQLQNQTDVNASAIQRNTLVGRGAGNVTGEAGADIT